MINTVFVLGLKFDYNGYRIIAIYESLGLAKQERDRMGAMPEFIYDDLTIDKWIVRKESMSCYL